MVHVLVKERTARHAGHADLLCHFDAELYVRLALFHIGRDIGQHKISALGVCKGDIELLHAAGENLLHMGVVVSKLAVVFIRHLEANDGRFHQRRSRADGVKVVVLLDPVHDGLRNTNWKQYIANELSNCIIEKINTSDEMPIRFIEKNTKESYE